MDIGANATDAPARQADRMNMGGLNAGGSGPNNSRPEQPERAGLVPLGTTTKVVLQGRSSTLPFQQLDAAPEINSPLHW